MKLEVPFLQLPVTFDAERLAQEVEALGESVWRPHPQGYAGNDALTLISVDGDPDSDAVRGPMRPTPHLERCPYLKQTLQAIGAVWGRSRLMRLSGQAEVTPHVDINYYWREHMRVHVPIVTQPTVRFQCGGADINMAAGECWIFDTWRMHRVINDAERPRIHLVADTVGGVGFWEWMRRARPHDKQIPQWQPTHVAPVPGNPALLELESVNLPTVMSPWEAREHLGFLVGEAQPAESLPALAQLITRFLRTWQALWAQHGDSGGLDKYCGARDELLRELEPFKAIKLKNSMPLVATVRAIVVSNLVFAPRVAAGTEARGASARV